MSSEFLNKSARLQSFVESFSTLNLSVFGDLILDRYIWGGVDRISPEAPVVVVNVTKESSRLGGAGNVAHNLASLGVGVSLCGLVGEGEAGKKFCSLLDNLGVDTTQIVADNTRPTTTKTRIIASGQQVVRVDREIAEEISENLSAKLVESAKHIAKNADGILISDYAKGVINPITAPVLCGLSSSKTPVIVDPKGPNYSLYKGATVVKPNKKEAEEASLRSIIDRPTAISVGKQLTEFWESDYVLLTLGAAGMMVVPAEGDIKIIETNARSVFDVSGAGDTVGSVFLAAFCSGATAQEAAEIANCAAGIVIEQVGTVSVQEDELTERLAVL